MDRTKYIVFDNAYAIVFPDFLDHDAVGIRVAAIHRDEPTSAGFISFNPDTELYTVYGESMSLNLKSNPTDAKLINRLLLRS